MVTFVRLLLMSSIVQSGNATSMDQSDDEDAFSLLTALNFAISGHPGKSPIFHNSLHLITL